MTARQDAASPGIGVRCGERPAGIELRRGDEFRPLAEAVNATLRSFDALDERPGGAS